MEKEQHTHSLQLQQRQKLAVTGVTEVVSFDEEAVVLNTHLGPLVVQGSGLQLKTLSVEGGQVAVEGQVCALVYQEQSKGGSWLRRLLG
jgi:sporulation protein YabP